MVVVVEVVWGMNFFKGRKMWYCQGMEGLKMRVGVSGSWSGMVVIVIIVARTNLEQYD